MVSPLETGRKEPGRKLEPLLGGSGLDSVLPPCPPQPLPAPPQIRGSPTGSGFARPGPPATVRCRSGLASGTVPGRGGGRPPSHRALAAAEEQRFSLPSWLHGWVPRLNWPKRVRGNSLQEQGLAQKGRRGAWPRMERVPLGPLGGSRVRFPGGQAQEGAARWQPRSLRPTVSPGGQWPGTRTAWAVVGRRAPWPGISKPRASAPPSVDFG